MPLISQFARMQQHGEWADQRMLDTLRAASAPSPEVLRELSHVRGAQEVWLSRIEQREASIPVWPTLSVEELAEVGSTIDAGWQALIEEMSAEVLGRVVNYRNSAGEVYDTPLEEIMLHVMLHGQYHRGKANAALRTAGIAPVGVDYNMWLRMRRLKD